jgi:hypothetical protein
MKNILSNGYNPDAYRYDSKNIVLHTLAREWAYGENAIKDYEDWTGGIVNPSKNFYRKKIGVQITKLKRKEREYYKQVLGADVGENYSFNDFMVAFNKEIKDIKPCLERLSNYNKTGSLYRHILNNIVLGGNGETAQSKKSKMRLQNVEQLRAITITYKGNNKAIKLGEIIIQHIERKKNLEKGTLTDDILNEIDVFQLESEILPMVRNELRKDYSQLSKTTKDKFEVPRLLSSMESYLKGIIRKTLEDSITDLTEEIVNNEYNQTIALKSQRGIFSKRYKGLLTNEQSQMVKGRTKDRQALTASVYNEKVRTAIMEYTLADKRSNEKIRIAFLKAWEMNKENILDTFYKTSQKQTGNLGHFTGLLGEFSNAFLYHYLSPSGAIKWTGDDYMKGEKMRADLILRNMGIQVKNFKETTLKQFPVAIKLHPYQLLTRLENAGFSDVETMGEIMANMMFNYDFIADGRGKKYIESFKKIAKVYMGAFLNFDLTDITPLVFNDTVNIWQVGNLLIPASGILQAYKDAYLKEGKNHFTINFNLPEPNITDNEFHLRTNIEGRTYAPPFTKYWSYSGNGQWRKRKPSQSGKVKNLLTKKEATIHTSFNFDTVFGESLKKYGFLFT